MGAALKTTEVCMGLEGGSSADGASACPKQITRFDVLEAWRGVDRVAIGERLGVGRALVDKRLSRLGCQGTGAKWDLVELARVADLIGPFRGLLERSAVSGIAGGVSGYEALSEASALARELSDLVARIVLELGPADDTPGELTREEAGELAPVASKALSGMVRLSDLLHALRE